MCKLTEAGDCIGAVDRSLPEGGTPARAFVRVKFQEPGREAKLAIGTKLAVHDHEGLWCRGPLATAPTPAPDGKFDIGIDVDEWGDGCGYASGTRKL